MIFSLLPLQVFATAFKVVEKPVGALKIPFLVNSEVRLNAQQEETFHSQKADYAELERRAPLQPGALMRLQADDLKNLTMEQFNQIYARLGSGPMPLGDYAAHVMQKPPVYGALKTKIIRQIRGASQFAALAKMICGREPEDCLFEFIWKGKRFHPKNDMDQIEADSIFNPAGSLSGFVPAFLRPDLTYFPMNTYCGISQVDSRKESIIVDAAFADDFPEKYVPLRDEIITRKNLNITEEFRMVRPGLYIGKVYTNKVFIFNVALEKTGPQNTSETANACREEKK